MASYEIDTLATGHQRHKLPAYLAWDGLLALALACGCATTGPARTEASDNAAFAAIQTREAEVAAAQRRVEASLGQCETLGPATIDVCRASAALCELAHALADPDALARCARTRELCEHDRAEAAARGCAGAPK